MVDADFIAGPWDGETRALERIMDYVEVPMLDDIRLWDYDYMKSVADSNTPICIGIYKYIGLQAYIFIGKRYG